MPKLLKHSRKPTIPRPDGSEREELVTAYPPEKVTHSTLEDTEGH
jgi:hypothetical protein